MANAPKALPTARDLAILSVVADEMRAHGLTQGDLADAAGISQSQVSRVLSGERPVTLPELLAFCRAVSLTLEELARRAGEA